MAVSRDPLGMNARNFLYIRKYNPGSSKRVADDKLETKKILIENGLPTPDLIATFYTRDDIRNFEWNKLPPNGFVIKPARGYGGEGILPIRKWDVRIGKTVTGQNVTVKEMESHLLDILDGAYSLQNLPDKAFIEERVILNSFFKKLGSVGIADIRIIVFNRIPIMAMMRLPTEESGGKANLHLGAIGIGIDIRTGITTHAIKRDKPITRIPSTNYHTRFGEIDIIAQIDKQIVFVEVKSRTSAKFGTPIEAITYFKLQKMIATAHIFLKVYKLENYNYRFDAIEVFDENGELRIQHTKNITL